MKLMTELRQSTRLIYKSLEIDSYEMFLCTLSGNESLVLHLTIHGFRSILGQIVPVESTENTLLYRQMRLRSLATWHSFLLVVQNPYFDSFPFFIFNHTEQS